MNYLEFVVGIFQSLAWPVTLVTIVYLLQDDVRAALTRVQKAKFPGGAEFAFGNVDTDIPASQLKSAPDRESLESSDTLDVKNYANLFWLGSDLMWTVDVLLRMGSIEHIRHGLNQARHHSVEVGLGEERIGIEIKNIRDSLQNCIELTSARRKNIAVQLSAINDQIGQIAESSQGKFNPGWDKHPLR